MTPVIIFGSLIPQVPFPGSVLPLFFSGFTFVVSMGDLKIVSLHSVRVFSIEVLLLVARFLRLWQQESNEVRMLAALTA